MLNILVVDDSLIMRRNIKKYILELGHNIIGEAKNGREAVKRAKDLKPDIITMDITMPEMDGIEALKAIMAENKDINVIMTTSHGQENIVANALQIGAKGYILKPVTKENLLNSIDAIAN